MTKSQIKEQALYRDILRGAFEVMWHRRELWLLGILASLLMTNGGAFEFIVRAIYKISAGAPYSGAPQLIQTIIDGIGSAETTTQISIFLTAILLAGIFALIAIIGVAASGSLFIASARYALKKKITAREAFALGMNNLGPLLLTQILGRITIFAAFTLAAIGVYAQADSSAASLVSIALFVLFAATALVISFVMNMTNAGIMIDKKRWINSAHDAFSFLRRHWLIFNRNDWFSFCNRTPRRNRNYYRYCYCHNPVHLNFISRFCTPSRWQCKHFNIYIRTHSAYYHFGRNRGARRLWPYCLVNRSLVRLSNTGGVPKLERLWQMLKNARYHVRSRKRSKYQAIN